MRRKRFRGTFSYILAIFLLLACAAAAIGQEPSIQIEGDVPLTAAWSASDGFSPLRFRIYNLSPDVQTISYRLDPPMNEDGLLLLDLQGDTAEQRVTLPPDTGQLVVFPLSATDPPPGKYNSTLVVSSVPGGDILLHPVQLTVTAPDSEPDTAAVAPLAASWTVTVQRWALLRSNCYGELRPPFLDRAAAERYRSYCSGYPYFDPNYLALDVSPNDFLAAAPAASTASPLELGRLVNETSDIATVYWTGEAQALEGGATGIRLYYEGLDEIGSYSGKISVPGGDEDTAVDLTVNQTTAWIWAVLTILAGTGLALLVDRWLNRDRKLRQLEIRIIDLLPAYDTRNGEYEKALQTGAAWENLPAYDLAPTISRQILSFIGTDGQSGRLGEVKVQNRLRLDDKNEAYQALVEEVDGLYEAVASWPSLAPLLVALKKERDLRPDAYWKQFERPSSVKRDLPKLVETTVTYLAGEDLNSTSEFEKRVEQVAAMTQFVKEWEKLQLSLVASRSLAEVIYNYPRFKALKPGDDDRTLLTKTKRQLERVHALLWTAPTPADMGTESIAQINEIEGNLLALQAIYQEPLFEATDLTLPPNQAYVLTSTETTWPRPWWSGGWQALPLREEMTLTLSTAWARLAGLLQAPVARAAAPPRELAAIADEARNRARAIDLLLFGAALLLAVMAGMELLYIGKNFGTWWDFLKLFTLGFAAKLGFDLVQTYLSNYLKTATWT
ncbi:MAG: hypothetical protein ACK2UK_08300 [Candidatus Promineifilaceae bacterium]